MAERELEGVLNSLNDGVLKGRFQREWAFSRWILDFFFSENRLGIEVDGGYHNSPEQRKRDIAKHLDCRRLDVTLLRLTNAEIFGNQDALVKKLREGFRRANQRTQRRNSQQ